MRFLIDECTGPGVATWLKAAGHDVWSAHERGPGSTDEQLLTLAVREGRIVVTNDSDFGELIYRHGLPHVGVVFMRLDDERTASKIEVLSRLLSSYADRLSGAYVVVTERAVRFADG